MNREDIIRMAREADFKANVNEPYNVTNEWVFRFAALVASAERSACVQIVEDEAYQYASPVWAFEIVNDIKARGQA